MFVSTSNEMAAKDAQDWANQLKERNVHLVLVGLGDIDLKPLKPLVDGNGKLDTSWNAKSQPEPPNYKNWFTSLACNPLGM